jgi:hypothetical protein
MERTPRVLTTWEPSVGASIHSFISRIDFLENNEARQSEVIAQAKRILSRSANPELEIDKKCSLIIGEVQSGKTLSFTSVIALARDNKIPLTILLGGTKRSLLKQTFERIESDLLNDSLGSTPKWLILKDVKLNNKEEILTALSSQEDNGIPEEYKKTVVLVIMKNKSGMKKVENLLRAIKQDLGKSLPTLIIDDEGDQASPNTKHEKDEQSATYSAIRDLRDVLPNHTYLSYTATPEANLLLELEDTLSPDSVVMLTHGEEYVGGYELFVSRETKFVNIIPSDELEVATNPSQKDLPPKSLIDALAYFIVSVAITQKAYPNVRPITMLIHPDSKIDSHNQYRKWVKSILDRWMLHFENDEGSDSKQTRIPNDFLRAIEEIKKTVSLSDIFPGEVIPENELLFLVRFWLRSDAIELRVVNSEKPDHNVSPSEWKNRAGWILIGAGKLDRGFVVEKLAVTYMPRGKGGGNVDTIQQRGRFFGYKKTYLELLRGWMSIDLRDAYKNIVETEDSMRIELKKFDMNGYHLQDWRRNMLLAPGLNPTRHSVISMPYSLLDLKDNSWFQQKHLFDPILVSLQKDENIETFLLKNMRDAEETSLDKRVNAKRHLRTVVSLSELYNFLVDWPTTGDDRVTFDKHLLLLKKFMNSGKDTDATLFFMNQLDPGRRSAEKNSVGERKYWAINNLHEGRSSSAKGSYIGDASIRSTDSLTIQFHRVIPRENQADETGAKVFAIALAWPNGFRKRILEQI